MSEARTSQPINRPSARIILLDSTGRVLLFSADVPDANGILIEVWVLPGGGVEAGETAPEAAARELYEETGLRLAPEELRGPVAHSRGTWTHHGIAYWTEDTVYVARIPTWTMTPHTLATHEQDQAHHHRWWPAPDLLQTDATIFPRGLGPLVARLLAGDEPQPPVELPW